MVALLVKVNFDFSRVVSNGLKELRMLEAL